MFKAAIERGESDARISYPEREQARRAASIFNFQFSIFNFQFSKIETQIHPPPLLSHAP